MPNKKTCFIIMPISTPESFLNIYRDGAAHFEHVLENLFIPSLVSVGYEPIPPSSTGSNIIQADIIKNLETADLVLCDISTLNANVFFEFGIRTALNKPVCLVKDEIVHSIPFDTLMLNCHSYKSSLNLWEYETENARLKKHIIEAEKKSQGENPLWIHFGLKKKGESVETERTSEYLFDVISNKLDVVISKMSLFQDQPFEEQTIGSYIKRYNRSQKNILPDDDINITKLAKEEFGINILFFEPIDEYGMFKAYYSGNVLSQHAEDSFYSVILERFNLKVHLKSIN